MSICQIGKNIFLHIKLCVTNLCSILIKFPILKLQNLAVSLDCTNQVIRETVRIIHYRLLNPSHNQGDQVFFEFPRSGRAYQAGLSGAIYRGT